MSLYLYSAATVAVIVWEHVANINHWRASPSFYLGKAAEQSKQLFTKLGNAIAHLSSFYTYLYLGELGKSVLKVTVPICQLAVSPLWTTVGYIRSLELYERAKNGNGWVVALGTVTLIGTGAYAAYRFGYIPSKNLILQPWQILKPR